VWLTFNPGQKQKDGKATGDPGIPRIDAASGPMDTVSNPARGVPRSESQPQSIF
jgi:hypothetical protein